MNIARERDETFTTDPPTRSGTELPDIDDIGIGSLADSEIPEVRHQAQAWLIANNASDQRAIIVFAAVLLMFAVTVAGWWAAILAGCILLVLPFRWTAGPNFRRGALTRGIIWANLGSWFLLFPLVIIIPDTLPIAMQNLIGPAILAATYLERRLVRRMVPGMIAIAIVISLISFTTDGFGLDTTVPRWVYLTVLLGYVGANMWLVMGDIQELNLVHVRNLRRAVAQNEELHFADRVLRDSRRRLLMAADEERVRLEQDLHDGAQQRLVSLSMQLRLAAELVDEGKPVTSASLMAMHHAATEAVDELRDLAHGVYPARLRELGLARALHAVARRSPAQIDIEDTTTNEIEASTQLALYFVCIEAIQNTTKHGGPNTAIRIMIATVDDDLVVTITDDGPGFDAAQHADSRGLLNMADRASALGGSFSIDSSPNAGTTVTVNLPVLAHDAATVDA